GLLRIGHSTARAVTKEARRLRRRVRRLLDATEHELLSADAKAIAVFELRRLFDRRAIQLHAVAAIQVVKNGAIAIEHDSRVMARNERILDRDVAVGASPKDRRPAGEIELLQQKSQTVPRHSFSRAGSRTAEMSRTLASIRART